MIQAVEGVAIDKMVHEIAAEERMNIHQVNRRLAQTRKLVKTFSTTAAYRVLLFARKIDLK